MAGQVEPSEGGIGFVCVKPPAVRALPVRVQLTLLHAPGKPRSDPPPASMAPGQFDDLAALLR